MLKKIFILTFILFIFQSNIVYANEKNSEKVDVVIYSSSTCITCMKAEKYIKDIETDYKNFNFVIKDISNHDYKEELLQVDKKFKVDKEKYFITPTIVIGNKSILIGEEVIDKIKGELEGYSSVPITKERQGNDNINLDNVLSPIYIFIAGIIDGVNPCAIAMLLFFIGFTSKISKKYMIKTCFSYIFGNFLAYFLLGTSIIKVALSFNETRFMYITIYLLAVVFSIKLAIDFIRDVIRLKDGKINEVSTQLSSKRKKLIHQFIQKYSHKRTLFIIAFLVGFVVSIFEFSCTGQVYLPTLVYMISISNSEIIYVFYLLLYNLAFIMPMLIIGISIYKGKQIVEISSFLVDNLRKIKFICFIFFIVVACYMMKQLISFL